MLLRNTAAAAVTVASRNGYYTERLFHSVVRRTERSVSIPLLTGRRGAKSWKEKQDRQDSIENTVFQYVGKTTKRAGRVYVWGYAGTGALGVRRFVQPVKHERGRIQQLVPHKLQFFDDLGMKVIQTGSGYGFTVFICKSDDEDSVYGTGINTDSQIGYVEYPRKSGRILDYIVEPVPVSLPLMYPGKTKLTAVGCGRAHTVIATDFEGVFSLGNNSYGQCGRHIVEGEIYKGSQVVNRVPLQHAVHQIVCGQDHTLLRTDDGKIYSCGLGADGQTGLGHYDNVDEPTLVEGDIAGENIIQVSSRADCVLAVSDKGDVFGWGNNEYDQLAATGEDSTQVPLPRHLQLKNVGRVVKVAAAGSMCALLNDQGQVYVWGFGLLGKGPKLEKTQNPSMIPEILFGKNEFNPDSKVVDIQCGIHYFAAKTNSGDLYTWGRNKSAALGLGHRLDQFFPIKVQVPAEVRSISCGVDHTVAMCSAFA